ncbi:MAG TPA: hypothetical protein VGX03_05085 [Candidatus Binatia bacterium]|jgi:hypothetical protein|nr:hypothetical protein [Candidatus Binatia bacterium]
MRHISRGLWGSGLLLLQVSSAFAHGMVGQRTFIEPFVTEDANPKNEFVLAKPGLFYSREGHTFSLAFSLEKKLSENFSVGLEGEWTQERTESHADGFQNPGVLLKYALWKSPVHEFILSPAVELEFPLGDREVGAERETAVTPLLLWAKGFGDLPQSLAYLRPLALMGDAGFEILTNAETETTLRYNALVMYSLPYLHAFVRDFGTPWPLRQLVPLVEFNFESRLNGAERTTEARVTPGLVYLGTNVQLGVAGQFALNHTTARELDPSVLFIVDLFYDDFLPALTWTPF